MTFSDRLIDLFQWVGQRVLSPRLDISYQTLTVSNLPPALRGMRLVQVSDIHVGPGSWWPYHLDRALAAIKEAEPDLLINTGDWIWRRPSIGRVQEAWSRIAVEARRRGIPQVAILGNHDYYAGQSLVRQLREGLVACGVVVLENDVRTVEVRGEKIRIAGLTDDATDSAFEVGVSALERAERPVIALIHEPDPSLRLPAGSADLILSGHTHGGQITIPGLTPWIVRTIAKSHFMEGVYNVNRVPLYVNRGLGTVGVPVRFRAPPEITVITLVGTGQGADTDPPDAV